ncbi:putative serine/threonine protein kinase [[Actinomadura] parvosata subsp. kistnae]|uniref:Serine/threonine protein kinase n=1 Tax=[Actinomadura] parvosata subsp. kistnae TaxID=1909395 RepID=A0A1V0AHU7_9ACTN|nr:serine/threonine-protein kinase [Nonomuraea sp. ATCC 55076]AQZ69775.1 serine/threonine protein kinase [Nonomuraea sp. ATCC 55076]SPL91489.1 putative serine/threonine protein kinase [Actinomadura parvosata subsp. kistnae]
MSKLGKVGPYTLVERLGRGGMGEVYLATTRRNERVALKVLHDLAEDETSRIRLEREVRALRRVESPYVARVLDADLSCARPYLVMEHIEGATLLDRVRQSGPLDVAQLVDMAQGIAAALAIIHAAGVVHRDLKPGNIIMADRGPVLIDFGIAQVLDATRLTMTGTFLGTPGYTAPEIFADEQVDSPADVHAWAATVAFAATGRPTFGRGTAEAQMYAVLNGQADLKGVPVELLPLVRAALNREPGKRPTAALLADRLSRLAKATNGATDTEPAPTGGRAGDVAEESGKGTAVRGRPADDAAARAEAAKARGEAKARSRPNAVPAEGKVPPPRGRTGSRPVPDGKGAAAVARSRAEGKVPAPRGRTSTDGKPGRTGTDGKPGRTGMDGKPGRTSMDGKTTGPRPKPATPRQRTAAAVRSRTAARAKGETARAKGASATTLPAGNGALLMLAVLAVPCVVASVILPIASIGITTAFVVLTRTIWMSHWMVRNRSTRRSRVTLRVLLFPVALAGAALTAVVWPGVPVAVASGGALWATGGGEIDSDWWQQAAPVTVAGVVFGMLCGGITGREIERIGHRLPDLRREGLRALAVLGGFVALCAAAVRAIALLL